MIPPGFSTPIQHNFLMENPFASLTDDERRSVLAAAGRRAESDLDESKANLERLLKRLEPLELLSAAALYGLHAVSGPITDYTGDSKPSQAAIELLQSLVLAIPAEEQGREATLQDSLGKCVELAESCLDALNECAYADLAKAEGSRSHAVVGAIACAFTLGFCEIGRFRNICVRSFAIYLRRWNLT